MNRLLVLVVFVLLPHTGCEVASRLHTSPLDELIDVAVDAKTPMSYAGLSQVVAFHKQIISGAKPKGRAGFESLMKMDVDTIVCVDGVAPDVKTAKECGIKTVHIPLKYDSPSASQIFDLTTVVARGRDRGNVYIHCHQGKHRSATVAAIVSIALGSLTLDEAKARMHVSQTSEEYKGLWEAVEQTEVINVFDLLLNEKVYPSIVQPEGITSQMIAIDGAMDNLLRLQDANWNAPTDHPDLVGVAEAGKIADIFRAIQLSEDAKQYATDFEILLVNALQQANGIEEALIQQVPTEELNTYMKRVEQSCINCHSSFRK